MARPWERKFLGYSMTWHQRAATENRRAKSCKRLKEKVREIVATGRGRNLAQVIEELNPLLRGWINYFRLTEVKGVLGGTRWLDTAQAALPAVAAMEACLTRRART